MKQLRLITISIILLTAFLTASAYDNAAFHCEKDTTEINALLSSPELKGLTPAERVGFFARRLAGARSSLRQEILDSDSIQFTVSIHAVSPLGFISTCVALAQAYETSSSPNWRDFAEKYENVMYKGGKAGGFTSKFLYGSDWIADNIFRGNIQDPTQHFDDIAPRKKEKSLDYISHHKEALKALSDPSTLERLKMLEMGFRNHQIPYISNGDLTSPSRFKKQAQEGDIFFLLTPDFNLDFREMGILVKDGDRMSIIHASYPRETVVIEELPFENYIKRNIKRIQGARIIRIN